jgi:hypothetical protein
MQRVAISGDLGIGFDMLGGERQAARGFLTDFRLRKL